MGAAFIYMYFVGAGVAAGAATVGLIVWKIVKGSNKQSKKNRGIV